MATPREQDDSRDPTPAAAAVQPAKGELSIVAVAKSAGVSKSTVSRVINHSPGVNPEMARAVLEAMARLGYQPPARRRGPKSGARRGVRTGNIAFLSLGIDAAALYRMPSWPTLLQGVETTLREHGLNLVLASVGADGRFPPAISPKQIDGLLVVRSEGLTPAIAKLLPAEVPTVALMRGFDVLAGRLDRVLYDNNAVGRIAAEYLLKQGHRHVAYMNVLPAHEAFAVRLRDFRAVIEAGGGDVLELMSVADVLSPRLQFAEYQSFVAKMQENPRRITGLFVPASAQLPVLAQAMEGRGVPTDGLNIVSCDFGEPGTTEIAPAPAIVDIGLELVGRRGVQQLLWRMAHPDEKRHTTLLIEPLLMLPGADGRFGPAAALAATSD